MLIQDVFKQFDSLFKEIDVMDQAAESQSQQGINLGELQSDSVKSITDLLYMP